MRAEQLAKGYGAGPATLARLFPAPPNIVHDVAAYLRAAERTPAQYEPSQLAQILHHDMEAVTRAMWELRHRRLDRPDNWPERWMA